MQHFIQFTFTLVLEKDGNTFDPQCNCLGGPFERGVIAKAEAFFPLALTHKCDIDTE